MHLRSQEYLEVRMADFLEEHFSFEFESEALIKSSWAGVGLYIAHLTVERFKVNCAYNNA
jgi:hypothetical protein